MLTLSTTETAKEIRKTLAAHFKGIRFSVRSHKYAGGSSIDIFYTDGPLAGDVEKVAKCFAGSDFDGMQDLKYSLPSSILHGAEVKFSCDFVFVHRNVSPQLLMLAAFQVHKITRLPLLPITVSRAGTPELTGPHASDRMPFFYSFDDHTFYPNEAGDPHWHNYRECVYGFARNMPIYTAADVPSSELPERLTPEYIAAQVAPIVATAY